VAVTWAYVIEKGVEVAGIEPASLSPSTELLRAQPVIVSQTLLLHRQKVEGPSQLNCPWRPADVTFR